VHRLANELVKSGHDVTCFSFSSKPEHANYNHIKLSRRSTYKLLYKFEPALCFSRIKNMDFEILHYHGDDYFIRHEKRRVRTFYGSAFYEALYARKISRFLYQCLFYIFELMSCMLTGVKTGISKTTCKVLPSVTTIIPCGVPLDNYIPADIKTQYPSLLFLGDFSSRKQGDYLLNIFINDILKGYPGCILTIIGPQKYNKNIDSVRSLGNVNENTLIKEYQKAWIYCMVSSYEGFGVPCIEAMACGTAVVAINSPGITEIITDNYNGRICNKKNILREIQMIIKEK